MHDRLIVGFDGSDTSLAALRWAAAEAECRKASVRVVSSYSMPPVMDYYGIGTAVATPSEMRRLEESCQKALASAVSASIRSHPGVGFDYRAVDEAPVECLVAEAAEADLLVVGSNGMGAAKAFLLGSVIERVLHESPCPVVVVPLATREVVGTVVVGTDGSDASTDALRWAADEADRQGAALIIMHAWEYPYGITDEGVGRGSTFAEVDAAIVLERAVEEARDRMAGEVRGQLVEGGPAQALIDASATTDLVIVGSRGRGGLRSMLLGSVARAVSAHATSPVAVVR